MLCTRSCSDTLGPLKASVSDVCGAGLALCIAALLLAAFGILGFLYKMSSPCSGFTAVAAVPGCQAVQVVQGCRQAELCAAAPCGQAVLSAVGAPGVCRALQCTLVSSSSASQISVLGQRVEKWQRAQRLFLDKQRGAGLGSHVQLDLTQHPTASLGHTEGR